MDGRLDSESRNRCDKILAYVEDMSEWYDEDLEGAPKRDFALRILDQIDDRDKLTRDERSNCENKILTMFDRGLDGE